EQSLTLTLTLTDQRGLLPPFCFHRVHVRPAPLTSVLVLLCSDNCGVITVKSAYYGRRDRTTCSEGRPAAQLRNSQCFNPTGKVAESCDGKTTCIIRASNSVFGDPCGGTYKYLEVDYTCEREFGSDCSHLYGGRRFTALIQHKAAAATQNPEPGFREAA
uniref:SUEL-type lectin domain-containing protein n=1 Tax=Salarias fasciatus TaxID=181472 RepID=A0A672HAP9_SALFA